MTYYYPTVGQIENRLRRLSTTYPALCRILNPPERTNEGRQGIVLEIAGPAVSDPGVRTRTGVLFSGGVHAREWAPPDILLNLAQQLARAYSSSSGLTFGSKSFSSAQVQGILDSKDLFLFPLVNPDGQNFSRGPPRNPTRIRWRKNRRPLSSGAVGVDINRNFDYLFNFQTAFNPAAGVSTSNDPLREIYCGSSAFSEVESRNVRWCFDNLVNIGYFVDVHSYDGKILYSWGDDEDQTSNPTMNFRDPACNGQRGIAGDSLYREYIPSRDLTEVRRLATAMTDAIRDSRGRTYGVVQAFGNYPTSGASDDYAYSRNFVNSSKPKVFSFTIECGLQSDGGFWPRQNQMPIIIDEISSALVQFCLSLP